MKNILFIVSLLVCVAGFSQAPNYNNYNVRNHFFQFSTNAFNLPSMGTPAFGTGQYVRSGAIIYDSTGGNKGIHVWNGTTWIRMVDTTWTSLITTKDRFGFLTEDTRATAARTFSAANQVFTIDSLGHGSLFRQRSRAIVSNTMALSNKDALDSAYLFLSGANAGSKIAQIGVSNITIATPSNLGAYLRFTSGGSAGSTLSTEMYSAIDAGDISHMLMTPTEYSLRSYFLGSDRWSNMSFFHDSTSWWQGLHRTSVINMKDGAQDAFARDSLTWRLTNRDASLTFDANGWHAWQKDGEYYFYNVARETDTTGVDLLVWDRADQELKRVPSNLVGGGGGSSGWALPLNAVADGDRFGSSNNRSIPFYTNNTYRGKWDSTGVLVVGPSATSDANHNLVVQQPNDAGNDRGIRIYANNLTTYMDIGYNGISVPSAMFLSSGSGQGVQMNERLSVGLGSVAIAALHVKSTSEQERLEYNGSNYSSTTVASDGSTQYDAVGSAPSFSFKDDLNLVRGSAVIGVGGVYHTNTTNTGNVGGGEDDLHTKSVDAGLLATDKDFLDFIFTFTVSADVTIKVYFGATQIVSFAATAANSNYRVSGQIIRTGAATQKAQGDVTAGTTFIGAFRALPTETLSGAVTFKTTGESTDGTPVDNDVVQTSSIIMWYPAK